MNQNCPSNNLSGGTERAFWVDSPQAIWRTPLICLVVPVVLLVATQWATVSPWGFGWLLPGIWSVLSVVAFLALIGVVLCSCVLFSKRRGSAAMLGLFSSLAFLAGFAVGVTIEQRIRREAFHKLAERSKPLIQAIQAYERKFGTPPAALPKLVPEFLAEVPGTGMGAYPDYGYVAGEEAQRFNSNPWALHVSTPSGGISFDKFLYYPLQNYPDKGRGGWLERIGDWAYVHE